MSVNPDVYQDVSPEVKLRAKKMMMWFIIFAVVMLFAGITSGLIVLQGKLMWVRVTIPVVLWWSMLALVVSSFTMVLSLRALRTGDSKKSHLFLWVTLILGLVFSWTQYAGWKQLSDRGMGFTVTQLENGLKAYHWNTLGKVKGTYGTDYWIEYNGETLVKLGENYYLPGDTGFMDPKNTEVMSTFNASGALIAVLIFVHLIHLFLGIIYHAVNLRRIAKNRLNASNYMSLYAGGMYWHFMGILWIYLFAFLFFIY